MPRWGKSLATDDLYALETQLRQSLVPVEVDRAFVEGVGSRLRAPRPVYVPQIRTWRHSWMLFGALSGTLLFLSVLTFLAFLRRRGRA